MVTPNAVKRSLTASLQEEEMRETVVQTCIWMASVKAMAMIMTRSSVISDVCDRLNRWAKSCGIKMVQSYLLHICNHFL
jgi:hypothetical protein